MAQKCKSSLQKKSRWEKECLNRRKEEKITNRGHTNKMAVQLITIITPLVGMRFRWNRWMFGRNGMKKKSKIMSFGIFELPKKTRYTQHQLSYSIHRQPCFIKWEKYFGWFHTWIEIEAWIKSIPKDFQKLIEAI